MKKAFLILSIIIFSNISFAQIVDTTNKLKVEINKNIELLGLAYFISFEGVDIEYKTVEIEGKKIQKKDWHNYGYYIYEEYKSYATSENLSKSFALADHLWLDYLTAFLLQVEDVPSAELTDSVKENYYINFSKEKNVDEAKQNAKIFLEGLNSFSKEINFESYLSRSQKYYQKVIEEIENGLPNSAFIGVMESYYKREFDNYILVPSLTIPKGMGFGIRNTDNERSIIFNVFGALDFQEFDNDDNLIMGFANHKKLRELSVHEFGHAFVNPVVAQLPESLFAKTEKLFELLKSAMSDQGYNTWKVCVYEHFVRAGEILIAEKLGESENAEKLIFEYVQTRQFKYIPKILVELRKYDNGFYSSYYDTVEQIMIQLSKL